MALGSGCKLSASLTLLVVGLARASVEGTGALTLRAHSGGLGMKQPSPLPKPVSGLRVLSSMWRGAKTSFAGVLMLGC